MDWGLNDREEHARILPAVRETIAAASGAGIPHVIVFSGNRRGRSDEEGVESCVRGLDALAAEAADASVTLLFELLNGVDHPDYHAASTAFMAEVVERVDAPSVRALYDVYHAARMGEDVVADVARHAPLIGHLHVAGAPGRGFPGPEQEIDYAAVIAAAEAAGYDGRVGHEFLCGPDPLDELERAHRLFATFA
jgi:hydroxypyruvate isomerase